MIFLYSFFRRIFFRPRRLFVTVCSAMLLSCCLQCGEADRNPELSSKDPAIDSLALAKIDSLHRVVQLIFAEGGDLQQPPKLYWEMAEIAKNAGLTDKYWLAQQQLQSYFAIQEQYLEGIEFWEQIRDSVHDMAPEADPSFQTMVYVAGACYSLAGLMAEGRAAHSYLEKMLRERGSASYKLKFLVRLALINHALLGKDFELMAEEIQRLDTFIKVSTRELVNAQIPVGMQRYTLSSALEELHAWQGDYQSALSYGLRGREELAQDSSRKANDLVPRAENAFNISEYHFKLGNITEAERYLTESWNLYQTAYGEEPTWIPDLYACLAAIQHTSGQPRLATQTLLRAFVNISDTWPAQSLMQPPLDASFLPDDIRMLYLIKTAQRLLSSCLGDPSQADRDSLQALWAYSKLGMDFVDQVRHNVYAQQANSTLLSDSSYRVHDVALQTALTLAEKEPQMAEVAFEVADRARGNWLVDHLQQGYLRNMEGLPPALAATERRLAFALTKAGNEPHRGAASSLRQEWDSLQQVLQSEYPRYHQIKYHPPRATVPLVQSQILRPQEAWLEYFVGKDALFTFLITQDHFQVFRQRLPKDFTRWVNEVKNMQQFGDAAEDLDIDSYREAGVQLYDLLLCEAREVLVEKGGHWSLTVVPHADLVDLQWGLLLREPVPAADLPYHMWPYVETDPNLTISYEVSASQALTQNLASRPRGEGSAWFASDAPNLRPLADQLKDLCNHYGGSYYRGPGKAEKVLKTKGPDYQIIHTMMHGRGKAGRQQGPIIILAEKPDAEEDNRLTLDEIYQLELRADLVVLEACETGVGRAHLSEGMLSIGRAFRYAGVPATVTAMWELPSDPTHEIVVEMYAGLAQGYPLDLALQRSKIKFLRHHSHADALPWKWAGLAAQGRLPDGFELKPSAHSGWSMLKK